MKRKALINGAIIGVAIVTGAVLSAKPWQAFKEQQRAADDAVVDMRASESQREAIVRQEDKSRSSVGKEEMARARGWLPPGEKAAPK
jgi:hypothetical protein